MPNLERTSQTEQTRDHLSETRSRMQAVDRRDWWVWATASVVMLLLIGATYFLVHSGESVDTDVFFRFDREQAISGLLGITLLFIVHSFYQQMRIKTLRRELSGNLERLLSVEGHAEEFQKLSVLDFLTGLYNRRFAEKHLEVEIARSQRHGQPLTLMAIDLDGFKMINDNFGHATGDQVLKYFSERLRKAARNSDIAIRMGGDEFLVLLPDCTPAQAELLLQRLSDLKLEYEGRVIPIEFSAGCAGFALSASPQELPDEFLKRADDALYVNKRARKAKTSAASQRMEG